MEVLTVLKDTPIPTILIAAGILFLVLSTMTHLGGKIELSGKQQKVSIAIGIVLLFSGSGLYLLPTMGEDPGVTSPPTILGVTIRESREEGELIIYERINFYDENGNTNVVERDLVDLSDPSQRQFIQIQNGVINDLPEIQKIRSSTTSTWYCEGRVYVATIEVSLLDKDGNRSEPVRYTIECK